MENQTRPLIVRVRLPFVRGQTAWDRAQGLTEAPAGGEDRYLRALNAEMLSSCAGLEDMQVTAVSLEGGEAQAFGMPDLTSLAARMLHRLPLAEDAQITLSTSLYGIDRLFLACVEKIRVSLLDFRLFVDDLETAKRIGRAYPNLTIAGCAEKLSHADIRHFGVQVLPGIGSEATELHTLQNAVRSGAVHVRLLGTQPPAQAAEAFLREQGFRAYAPRAYALPGFEQRACFDAQVETLGLGPGMKTFMDGILSKTVDSVEDYVNAGGDYTQLVEWAREL